MYSIVIAPNDLRVYDGTTVRITGSITSVSRNLDEVLLVSKSINDELNAVTNLRWIKAGWMRPLTLYPLSLIGALTRHKVITPIFKKPLKWRNISKSCVIHAHSILSLTVAINIKKYYKDMPVILDIHGLSELNPSYEFLVHRVLTFLSRIIEKYEFRNLLIDAIIVASDRLKDYLCSRYKIPRYMVFTVTDGINVKLLSEIDAHKGKSEAIRKSLNIYGKKVETYIGTPSYFHGFIDLLKAMKVIEDRGSDDIVLMAIVPKMGYAMSLARRAHIKNIIVLENIPREVLYDYLLASDVLVIPHRKGTLFDYVPSNKLFDYISTGKPIVGSDLPGIRYILHKYEPKVLVRPNDPEALASGILNAIQMEDHVISWEVIWAILSKYSWSNVGRQLLDVYKEVLKRVG